MKGFATVCQHFQHTTTEHIFGGCLQCSQIKLLCGELLHNLLCGSSAHVLNEHHTTIPFVGVGFESCFKSIRYGQSYESHDCFVSLLYRLPTAKPFKNVEEEHGRAKEMK